MKKKASSVLFMIIFLTGLSLLLYPTVSDQWNAFKQSRAISDYSESVAEMDRETYDQIWSEARDYNASLFRRENSYLLSETQKMEYDQLLNINGLGIMGYVEIPSIGVRLPIYHGTDESVLQTSIGHMEWTSLPVGGKNSHCVISGHRGLPSAKLFTDLDHLDKGDRFSLFVLDEVLTYEVDQILVVEPENTEALLIVPDMDLCTLVTCTPYGINTHRLLVRGHRVEEALAASEVESADETKQMEPGYVAVLVGVPLLLVLLIAALLGVRIAAARRKRKMAKESHSSEEERNL